ncbi:hypothetical protein HPB50_006462 [Hyalomma asiaticum]|uniref:Uncharacterized protein n=1 Tax=Hyalomma asiaticum TaxID=266040 RepID=A0ACB7RH46_HYAAI|nr:hypothetical protein HPB50_006462 [Hyalomma asiaticum]
MARPSRVTKARVPANQTKKAATDDDDAASYRASAATQAFGSPCSHEDPHRDRETAAHGIPGLAAKFEGEVDEGERSENSLCRFRVYPLM